MNTTTTRTVALASVIAGALASVAVTGGSLSPAAAADTTTATTTVSTSESAGNEGLAALVQPSVVYETITYTGYVYDPYLNGGEFLDDAAEFSATFTCSGFVVDPDGYIATAGHCLDMEAGKRAVAEAGAQWAIDTDFYTENYSKDELADSYEVHTYDPELDKLYNKVDRTVKVSWGASVSGIGVEKRLPARVIGVNSFDDGDTALIKVDETGLNAIDLAEETPEINTDVVTVGYPGLIETYTDHDLVPTFNEGTVSSTKTVGDGLLSILQISAPMAHGMSGGPTVNADGEVVGINSSGFDGEDINYVIPVDLLRELMADKGVTPQISDTTQAYRDGIHAVYAGDKQTAVDLLTTVVEEQPANPFANDYLARAKDLPDPAPAPRGDFPWTLVVIILAAVGVLTLGLITLLIILRGRRTRPAPVGFCAGPVPPPVATDTFPPGSAVPHRQPAGFWPHS